MTLTCNQCGAPLVITDPNLPFVSCSYCQTATAVPARPAPPPEPRPKPEPSAQPHNASNRQRGQHGRGPNIFAYLLGRATRALTLPALMLVVGIGFAASRGAFEPLLAALQGPPAPAPARAAELVSDVRTVEPPPVTLPTEVVSPKKPVPAAKKGAARSTKGPAPTPSASATGALVPPPPPVSLKVSISGVRIEGKSSYPKDQLRAGLSGAQGQFRNCYAVALAADSTVAGQMDIGFQIGKDGATRGVGITNPSTPTSLNVCVTRVMTLLRFSKPEDGVSADARFVLRLSTGP